MSSARTRDRILYPFTEKGLQALGKIIQDALDKSGLTKVAFAKAVCEAAGDNVLDIHSLSYLLTAGDPTRGSGGKNLWRLKYIAPFTGYSESELLQIAMGNREMEDYLPLLEPLGARRLKNLIAASAAAHGGWQEEEFVFAGVDRYVYRLATMQIEKDLTRVELSIKGAAPLAAVLYEAQFEGETPRLNKSATYEYRCIELWGQLGKISPKLASVGLA